MDNAHRHFQEADDTLWPEATLRQDIDAYRNEIAQQNDLIRNLQSEIWDHQRKLDTLEHQLLASRYESTQQEQRLARLQEQWARLPAAVLMLDENGILMNLNRQAEAFFGQPAKNIQQRPLRTFITGDAFRRLSRGLEALRRNPAQVQSIGFLELRELQPFSLTLSQVSPGCLLGVIQDLSSQMVATHSERMAHFALDQLREGVLITDERGTILRVNQAFTEISGYTAAEAIGKTPALLHSGRHLPRFYESMWSRLQTHGWWSGEVWNRRKNGEIYPEWLQINRIQEPLTQQSFYVALFSDITERKAHQSSLDRLAHYDALTGLPNRRFFEHTLENQLNRARKNDSHILAILFVDLDKFKEVNDRYGHQEGDLILKEAAQRITACIRDTDMVARIGGDEFLLTLNRLLDPQTAQEIADKVIAALQRPYVIENRQHRLTASIGIAFFPEHGLNVEDLMRRADSAMYKAKARGKDCWALFDLADEHSFLLVDNAKKLIWQIIEAPDQLLTMHYQPIFCSQNLQQMTEMEALLRVNPELGKPPRIDELIRLAEEARLMIPLGEAIFHAVCQFAVVLKQRGHNIPIAVNLSAEQFFGTSLAERLASIAQANHLELDRFHFEITETATMKNLAAIRDTLLALQGYGARILLDDFGTGYASLSQLRDLPVDIVKLDQSFVKDIGVSPTAETLIRAMLAMIRALGLDVVAEGVETQAQLDWLHHAGADCIQGYLLARPQPTAHILEMLERAQPTNPDQATTGGHHPASGPA